MSSEYNNKPTEIEPEKLLVLDGFFKQGFTNIHDYLNGGVVETNMSNGKWLIPIIDVKPGKPTIPSVEEVENAFLLNDAGEVTMEFEKVPVNMVVIRYILTYETALFASKSIQSFQTIISPVVHDMIAELRSIKGFSEDSTSYGTYYGQFTRPGQDETVFREIEHRGVELRLTSDTSRLPSNK